jgi:hypothetical protein
MPRSPLAPTIDQLLELVPESDRCIVLTARRSVHGAASDGHLVVQVPDDVLDFTADKPLSKFPPQVASVVERECLVGRLDPGEWLSIVIDTSDYQSLIRARVADYLYPRSVYEASSWLPSWLEPAVFRDVITVALQLKNIPKERRTGSMLVVGDPSEVRPYAQRCEFVTFGTIKRDDRQVGSPEARQLIRKLAPVDHVYLVDTHGYLHSLVEYIFPPEGPQALGLGSRHTSAAALSAAVDVVAVTVQGSTGTIRAYHKGEPKIVI